MAALNFNQSLSWVGLGTYTFVAPYAAPFVFDGKVQCPSIVTDGVNSAVVVTISQNGTPVYTGNAGAQGFYEVISCASGDSITIVFSSAAAVDQGLNIIKATIAISQGVA